MPYYKRNFRRPRFTRAELIEKKKRYIANNQEREKRGLPPRPLPAVFKNLKEQGSNRQRKRNRPPPLPPRPHEQPKKSKISNRVPKHTANQIKKVEAKAKSKTYVKIASQPSKNVYELDITGIQYFIETMAVDASVITDLFSEILPLEFAFYCVYVFLIYLKTNGDVTNAAYIPVNADKSKLPVPMALAKYMEYFAPYTSDALNASTSISLQIGDFFNANPSYTSLGLNTGVWASRPVWFPQWRVLPVSSTSNDGADNNHMVFAYNDTGGYPFSTFLTTPKTINTVANIIGSRLKCVPMDKVAKRAPDSSAYARLTVPFPGQFSTGSVRGLDENFDAELVQIFSPEGPEGMSYTDIHERPFPLPTTIRPNPLFAANGQIASMFNYLANTQAEYKPGRIRDVCLFDNCKLESLYPLEQPITSAAFSQVVTATHQQLMNAKQAGGGTEVIDQDDTIAVCGAMVALSAFQKKITQGEVLHWNTPPCAVDDGLNVSIPQFFYADASFADVEVPLMTADHINSIGPVVIGNRLRVPGSDYNGVVTHATGTLVGPMAFGVNGFDTAGYDTTFPSPNLYTTGWGILLTTNAVSPKVIANNTTVPPTIYASTPDAWTLNNYGAQPSYENYNWVHPAIPTGAAASALISQYNSFLQGGQFGQTIVTAPIGKGIVGDRLIMGSVHTIPFANTSVGSVQPTAPSENRSVVVNYSPGVIIPPTPTQTLDLPRYAIHNQGLTNANAQQSDTVKAQFKNMKAYKLNKPGSSFTDPDQDINGPHVADVPWGAGIGAMLSQLARSTTTPTSKIKDIIEKSLADGSYDPSVIFKKWTAPSLERSLTGAPQSTMEAGKYVDQQVKGLPVKKKNLADNVKDGVASFTRVIEGAAGIAEKVTEIGGKVLSVL